MISDSVVNITAERAKRSRRRKSGPRVAWNVMSERELHIPGALLLLALLRKAMELGHQLQDMSRALGVTYGYISQLRNGLRQVVHISPRFADACAKYLGVPVIAVKLMAGQVSASDFVLPTQPLHTSLDAGLKRIEGDALLGSMMPSSVYTLDDDTKAFIIACYEQATAEDVLPSRALPKLLQDLQHAAIAQAEHDARQARESAPGDRHA